MLQIRHNHEGWNQNIFIKINWHLWEVVNIKLSRYKSNHKNRLSLFNFWTNNTEPWDRRETSITDDNLCWTQIELSGHHLTRGQGGDAGDRRLALDNYDHLSHFHKGSLASTLIPCFLQVRKCNIILSVVDQRKSSFYFDCWQFDAAINRAGDTLMLMMQVMPPRN